MNALSRHDNAASSNQPEISVIVPIYNEAAVVATVLHDLRETMETLGKAYEIIAVDDGSHDGTNEILSELCFVRKVTHPYNKGNGAAVKTGIRSAKGKFIILLDGDGQHDPNDIPKLLAYAETHELVIGSRTASALQSPWRYWANRFYNWLASYVSEQTILDLTSGFRLVHRDKLTQFLPLLPNRFSYPTTSTLAFIRSGYSVKFVPLTTRKRTGKSKISPLRDGVHFFLIIVKITVLFSPFKVFAPVGLLSFALGVLYAFYKIVFLEMRYTNLSIMFIITGVLIFLIGLVSEQITMLRFERLNQE